MRYSLEGEPPPKKNRVPRFSEAWHRWCCALLRFFSAGSDKNNDDDDDLDISYQKGGLVDGHNCLLTHEPQAPTFCEKAIKQER